VLFSGHDLKFIRPLISALEASAEFVVDVDEHTDHAMSDDGAAKALLPHAETIFCEWAMGNAAWFSKRKRPGQTLIVRLHLQEVQARLKYLWATRWEAVDHLVCICQHTYDWMCAEFPGVRGKALVIYNPIDALALAEWEKLPHSEFNLGFVGMVPQRKRLDIAFDVFSQLRRFDHRYSLHVKGRRPSDYPWMTSRQDEMSWYRDLERRIEQSPHRNAVVFDPHGADMPAWYSAMGFILSTSDFEGSHQAVAEGMATGCIPVIRDWDGADRIYPGRFQFRTVEQAVALIRKWHTAELFSQVSQFCRDYACGRFDNRIILKQLIRLVRGGVERHVQLPKCDPGPTGTIAVLGYLPPGTRNGYRIRIEQEVKQLRRLTETLILIVLHPPAPGAELAAHARDLAALGCRVRLVEVSDFFAINLSEDGALPAVIEIERLIAEHNIAVLHAEALYCMRLARMLGPRCTNVRIVFDIHGISPEEEAMTGASSGRVRAIEQLEREAILSAHMNIFVSRQMVKHYAAKYELPPVPHLVIPCCVESRFFTDAALPGGVRLPSDRFILTYAGTMAAWQCVEQMLSLFQGLQAQDRSLFLLLLTPAGDHEKVREAALAAGIPDEAYLVEEVPHDEVPACLQHADLGLLLRRDHPVNRVSSPTKFAEYLASGLPVLMTDSVGDYSADTLAEGLGLVVSWEDVAAPEISDEVLARVAAFLRDVRTHRDTWRDRCRAYARSHLYWETGILALYDYLQFSQDS
jgi:glycosyltransferase involved in cell wall biosynthesis